MALVYYGATSATVLKVLRQLSLTAPDTTDIVAGGMFMDAASAKIGEALDAGGFSSTAAVTSTTNPRAYARLTLLLSRLCALYYIDSCQQRMTGPGEKDPLRDGIEAELAEIANGGTYGDLTSTTGSNTMIYTAGDDDISDLADTLPAYDEEQ